MMIKLIRISVIAILLTSLLSIVFRVEKVQASGTIYIRVDGSIDPPTANITTTDNVTYTFTDNNYDEILVERSNIIIDGAGYMLQGSGSGNGFDWSGINNVTIQNTNIKNFYYGIVLSSSSNSTISGNNITANSWCGIRLSSSSNNSISGNMFTNDGLYVLGSYQNSVENNTVNGRPLVYLEGVSNYTVDDAGQVILIRCDNIRVESLNLSRTTVGIELWETGNSTISGNNITANNWAGIWLSFSSNSTISGNNITANNREGIWLDSSSGNKISGNNIADNGYGIILTSFSNYNSISGNSITNNYFGIWPDSSSYNSISGNNIGNNDYGISLSDSSNSTISGNNITANNWHGIGLYESSNNTISENTITANNREGIWLDSSSNNKIFHNNIINNFDQVYSSNSVNIWDDGYPSGGNYWSDFTGIEVKSGSIQDQPGSDGIGDVPYVVHRDDRDLFPLMKSYPWDPHDIGITNVEASKKVVGQGYSVRINLTIFNYGNNTESYNVTANANSTIVDVFENITINGGNSTTFTIEWNTTSWAKGNYTISASATPVLNETDTTDNMLVDGWIFVTIPGDVDGDKDVDIFDIVAIATAYGSAEGDPAYNPNYDIDGDGDVDVFDIVAAASHYGESW